ncbi:unnamed protein product [Moneuplotes crassus]|uniref:Uncharacterized protein n=2 Tax=Euplotes crassus TaxID=5936 RepID=A0AAD1UST4_EUPCR|nr:unnamed protein product [Moneuplotes crassus]
MESYADAKEESKDDWGAASPDRKDDQEESDQDEELITQPIEKKSVDKPKVVIVLSLKKLLYLPIKREEFKNLNEDVEAMLMFNKHKLHWYWRQHLASFLDIIMSHPRAIVVLSTTKKKKNTHEIITNLKHNLETYSDWDEKTIKGENKLEKVLKWFEKTMLYQENHCTAYTIPETKREEMTRDLNKIVFALQEAVDDESILLSEISPEDIKAENIICVETEALKMKNHPDHMLYAPEIDEADVVENYSNNHEDDEQVFKDVKESNQIIESLFRALNDYDDISAFIKDKTLGTFTNQNDTGEGYISTQNMLSYPDIDLSSLYSHKTLGWLFSGA